MGEEVSKCKLQIVECYNLVLRTAKKGKFEGQRFFGCKNYPDCLCIIPLHFDENAMTEQLKKLAEAFGLFVRSNYFIYATYGVVYFNLKNAAFMDYLLRTDIVYIDDRVEIGLTGAKVYYELFYHLYLIPTPEIRLYLISNFPNSYKHFITDKNKPRFFSEGIDYENNVIDENYFKRYSDIEI